MKLIPYGFTQAASDLVLNYLSDMKDGGSFKTKFSPYPIGSMVLVYILT